MMEAVEFQVRTPRGGGWNFFRLMLLTIDKKDSLHNLDYGHR